MSSLNPECLPRSERSCGHKFLLGSCPECRQHIEAVRRQQKGEALSFFDTFKDTGGGGKFINAAEKQVLIEGGVPFKITGLAFDEHNEHGPRYIAFCLIPDVETGEEEERKIGFPVGTNVPTRDNMLTEMKKYLEGDGSEPVLVKMEKPGKAIFLVNAES